MPCAYITKQRDLHIATAATTLFGELVGPQISQGRVLVQCKHRSKLRWLGGALVDLCKCHHTRLKKKYRRKRMSMRMLQKRTPRIAAERSRKERNRNQIESPREATKMEGNSGNQCST